MKIVRIYNNNVVVSLDDDGDEMIAIGKGIGFHKKIGNDLDLEKVERIFVMKDKKVQSRLEELVKNIPMIYLKICEKIVQMINGNSDIELNENIYVALTDHISVSLEREKKGIILENPFEFEIEKIYSEEYSLAKKASKIIEEEVGVKISKSEISFITLHIVNANQNQNVKLTIKISNMMDKIIKIIEKYVYYEFDKGNFIFMRFIRHLKFFLRRSLEKKDIEKNDYFYKIVIAQFPETFQCVKEICAFVEEETGEKVSDTEKGYLMYHLLGITKEKGNQVVEDGL